MSKSSEGVCCFAKTVRVHKILSSTNYHDETYFSHKKVYSSKCSQHFFCGNTCMIPWNRIIICSQPLDSFAACLMGGMWRCSCLLYCHLLDWGLNPPWLKSLSELYQPNLCAFCCTPTERYIIQRLVTRETCPWRGSIVKLKHLPYLHRSQSKYRR